MGLWELFTNSRRNLVQASIPRRTFADVILPEATRQSLEFALNQIEKHELIFQTWGLGERHSEGTGLAFAFAGPPGTGKTICAEALANALGKRLLVVRYSELESMWVGETGKNVSALFRIAAEQDAVLFFDEADAIASRRFSSLNYGYEREANAVVNVLLAEIEQYPGVTIFATNLAANFDPAFERRIRTHILFRLPGVLEREEIWKVQLHAGKTPLAPDVDFRKLAAQYEVSGGDIKNAVLKAAQIASLEPIEDAEKQIHQRHFEAGMQEVLRAREVMGQSLFGDGGEQGFSALLGQQQLLDAHKSLKERIEELDERVASSEAEVKKDIEQLRRGLFRARVLNAGLALLSAILVILLLVIVR